MTPIQFKEGEDEAIRVKKLRELASQLARIESLLGVRTIQPGAGIAVDNSDPANPVVSIA